MSNTLTLLIGSSLRGAALLSKLGLDSTRGHSLKCWPRLQKESTCKGALFLGTAVRSRRLDPWPGLLANGKGEAPATCLDARARTALPMEVERESQPTLLALPIKTSASKRSAFQRQLKAAWFAIQIAPLEMNLGHK